MRQLIRSLARKFRTADLLLSADLEQLTRDIESAIRLTERGAEKRLSISKQISDRSLVQAAFGEVVRVAPASAQTVLLPRGTPNDVGSWVGVERVSGSGAITVSPTNATINGATTWTAPYSVGVTLIWFDGTNWSTIGGATGGELPVGSIYMAVVDTDPATLLGYGTWAAIGAGRVLVGQDTTQIWCDVLEETGGSSEHDHTVAAHDHTITHTHAGPSHDHTITHTHAGPSHDHTITHTHTGPSHTHDHSTHAHQFVHYHPLPLSWDGSSLKWLGNTATGVSSAAIAVISVSGTTGSGYWQLSGDPRAGDGTALWTTDGPSTANTGAAGTGNTGASSAASTGAGGTGNTGASSAASTGLSGTGNTGASSAANTGSSGTLTTGSTDHRMEYLVVKIWKRTA